MKLRFRFLQLPILFDADRLAAEVAALPADGWRAHPKGFPGNDALALITSDGDPSSDARGGSMRPTPHLLACPYVMQTLDALGATWGRSRLMRLSGDAEVTPHVDTDYYWRDHMRVHVPIVTQPTVRFTCGDETVNMGPGECWLFDTWSLHKVHNDAVQPRIHLVADTVGGDGLLTLIERGRASKDPRRDWSPRRHPAEAKPLPKLAYESRNLPSVMTPWELRDHLGFLLSEVAPGDARMGPIAQSLNRLRVNWHALWAQSGDAESAQPHYARLLTAHWDQIVALGAHEVALRNQMPLGLCLKTLIFDAALGGAGAMDADERNTPSKERPPALISKQAQTPRPSQDIASPNVNPGLLGRDQQFDRPIFIVSSPRSGSSLLFETLSSARDLFTIGGESHGLIEAIAEFAPQSNGWHSNRLTEEDAHSAAGAQLRARFAAALTDREGQRPRAQGVRMLEKTPKNALRIPFLATLFPQAQFIYLYRDPMPTLASMMEAWSSGRFRTYPHLPGWSGLPWSLALIPGWRNLEGAKLNEIVARQWSTITDTLLDDLGALDRRRWTALRYDQLIAEPQACVTELCERMGLVWDRNLGAALPLAKNTLSAPDADKWRQWAKDLDAVHDLYAAADRRALSIL